MSWQQVHGHDRQIDRFRRAVAAGRLGHAYLFVGPAGIGKKRFAIELAKALLCEGDGGQVLAACDRCPSCHLVDAGTHPDLVLASRPLDKHEFPIEAIRVLCSNLALKPARGRRRIAVVDDVDDFNEESANCFLKTLEEPAPGALLILVGTDAERQLPTIRSRCQVVMFEPLDDATVAELLRGAGDVDSKLLSRAVRLADGSPGTASRLLDPALWELRRKLLDELAKPKPDGYSIARLWLESNEAAAKEAALLMKEAADREDDEQQGKDSRFKPSAFQRGQTALILRVIIDAYRQALALATGRDGNPLDPSEAKQLEALAEHAGVAGLLDHLDRLLEAESQNERFVQLTLIVEAVADALTLDAPATLRPAWGLFG